MDSHWLEVLSGIDKMVLGSIVGSVVLAFILLVVVFSVKIKSQQDNIGSLREDLGTKEENLKSIIESISKYQHDESDAQRTIEHYQGLEKELRDDTAKLQDKLEVSATSKKELRAQIEKLKKEKKVIIKGAEKIQQKLEDAQEEIEAGHKRNEFWIDQISELRTKHEALSKKLDSIEGKK